MISELKYIHPNAIRWWIVEWRCQGSKLNRGSGDTLYTD